MTIGWPQNVSGKLLTLFAIQFALIDCAWSQTPLRDADIQFAQSWLEQVRVGVSDDRLLTAAIVARPHDAELASTLLTKALGVLEHEPLLLSTAAQNCLSAAPADFCEDNAVFEAWLRVEPNNLEPYLYSMVRLIDTGNSARALEILADGLKAADHSIHYLDKVDFLAGQLVALGVPANEASFPAEIYADPSANYSLYVKTLAACTSRSAVDENWKLPCLFLGARMQNTSSDLMPKVFGGAIQRDVLKAVGADEDLIQLVIEHNEWVGKVRDMANAKVDWMAGLSTTSERQETWTEDLHSVTEFEAILRAIYRTQ